MIRLGRATVSRQPLPGARAGLSFLLLLLLLLSPLAARAAVYTFSGSSFPSCSNGSWSQSGSTWTCNGATTLAAGDSISPSGAITVLAKAGITLSGNNAIGTASASVNLATEWGDLTASGSGTVIRGNLTAGSGTITLTSTTVNGTVTKTGGGGSITITGGSITGAVNASSSGISASGGTVFGSSVTASGAISLTGGGSVAGNVSGNNGVTASGGVIFSGSVTSSNGSISLAGGSVAGNVNGNNGVTASGGVTLSGNVTASSGAISLTGGSVVGQVHSTCCAVTTNNTNVGNGIRSDNNTVTINGGTVSGAIYSSGGGGITINNATIPSGSVITSNVAININGSTLGSSESPVDVSSNNVVNISNSTVYGNVTGGNWSSAVTISNSSTVHGVCTSNTNSNVNPGQYNDRCEGGLPVTIAHYAISFPNGNAGVTCEALKVQITAHDSNHAPVNPPAGTTITVSTTGGGSIVSGSGGSTHTFGGTDSQVDFWLTRTTPGVVNVNVSEGARTESATEDPNATFADAAFRVYACTGTPATATCGAVSSLQIAGKPSNHAPDGQNLYLRAVRTDTETGACVGGLPTGGNVIQFGYECNEPSTCTAANLMNIAGATSADVARNANGAISASSGAYTNVTLNFDGNGYAPFVLNYRDAGRVTLHARKAQSADAGPPPRPAVTIHGATTFHVRPFAFLVDVSGNPKTLTHDGTKFKAAGESFSATVRGVVWDAADDVDGGIYDGQPRIDADLTKIGETTVEQATTRNFAWETVLKVDPDGGYTPVSGVRGVLLQGASAAILAKAAFQVSESEGIASVANLNYSEVGSFTLLAETTNAPTDYLGQSGFKVRGRVIVGRFVPHHFGVVPEIDEEGTPVMALVQTRSDITVPPGGAASAFTYMGEPMQVKVTLAAYNAAEGRTLNYVGDFAKLDGQTLGADLVKWTTALGLGAVSGATNLSDRLFLDASGTHSAAPTNTTDKNGSTPGWSDGKSYFRFNLIFARKEAAGIVTPDGPYPALKVGMKPLDADGVTLPPRLSTDTAHCVNLDVGSGSENSNCNPGATETMLVRKLFTADARFGRLRLTNAYGSVSPLKVPVEAQYWSGRSWVLNANDALTSLGAFSASYPSCNVSGAAWTVPTPTGTLDDGKADIAVAPASPGTCILTLGVPTWLRGNWGDDAGYGSNPSAKATFGIFSPERRRTIHIRELY
ncbi:MAG: hypothetical protein H3C26_12750 [Rhodocyclaceae bacterium]|nr:hypothetical protein [Rhodocyclaceae bacterium]